MPLPAESGADRIARDAADARVLHYFEDPATHQPRSGTCHWARIDDTVYTVQNALSLPLRHLYAALLFDVGRIRKLNRCYGNNTCVRASPDPNFLLCPNKKCGDLNPTVLQNKEAFLRHEVARDTRNLLNQLSFNLSKAYPAAHGDILAAFNALHAGLNTHWHAKPQVGTSDGSHLTKRAIAVARVLHLATEACSAMQRLWGALVPATPVPPALADALATAKAAFQAVAGTLEEQVRLWKHIASGGGGVNDDGAAAAPTVDDAAAANYAGAALASVGSAFVACHAPFPGVADVPGPDALPDHLCFTAGTEPVQHPAAVGRGEAPYVAPYLVPDVLSVKTAQRAHQVDVAFALTLLRLMRLAPNTPLPYNTVINKTVVASVGDVVVLADQGKAPLDHTLWNGVFFYGLKIVAPNFAGPMQHNNVAHGVFALNPRTAQFRGVEDLVNDRRMRLGLAVQRLFGATLGDAEAAFCSCRALRSYATTSATSFARASGYVARNLAQPVRLLVCVRALKLGFETIDAEGTEPSLRQRLAAHLGALAARLATTLDGLRALVQTHTATVVEEDLSRAASMMESLAVDAEDAAAVSDDEDGEVAAARDDRQVSDEALLPPSPICDDEEHDAQLLRAAVVAPVPPPAIGEDDDVGCGPTVVGAGADAAADTVAIVVPRSALADVARLLGVDVSALLGPQ